MKTNTLCIITALLLALANSQVFPKDEASQSAEREDVIIEHLEIEPPPHPAIPAPPPGAKPRMSQGIRRGTKEHSRSVTKVRNFPPERSPRALIVLESQTDPKVVQQIQEDMAVMSRVLEKGIKEVAASSHWKVLGIEVFTLPGSRPTKNLYLENYGVIFTFRVNMPLVEEPKAAKEGEKEEEEVDTAWEEARSEVFGETRFWTREDGERKREFDPHAVDQLRESLIETLRNASKIRNLKQDDWVTIVVTGQGKDQPPQGDFGFHFNFGEDTFVTPFEEVGGSTMVIRARKSDIDDFAKRKGKDLKSFKAKVSVLIY